MSDTSGFTSDVTVAEQGGRRGRRGRSDSGAGATPDLGLPANRREIPLTSFDFTGGAFSRTVRARRISIGAISLLVIVVAFLGFSAISATMSKSSTDQEIQSLVAQQARLVGEFGKVPGVNVDPTAAIDRDLQLANSFNAVANRQADVAAVLADIAKVNVEGVTLTGVKVGSEVPVVPGAATTTKPESDEAASEESTGTPPAEPTTPASSKGIQIELQAAGSELLNLVTWADQVRQSPLLTDVNVVQSGTAVTVTGTIAPGRPPVATLARMDSAGVLYIPPAGVETTTEQAAPADAADASAAPATGDPLADLTSQASSAPVASVAPVAPASPGAAR